MVGLSPLAGAPLDGLLDVAVTSQVWMYQDVGLAGGLSDMGLGVV